MSKRKTSAVSKHARSSKIAAKSQRAIHDVVRSPKGSHSKVTSPYPDDRQEAPPALRKATVAPVGFQPTVQNNAIPKGFGVSSASAMLRAYQTNLLEMAQANMQFTLEFAQRFAAIKSPVEFSSWIAEFTSKRLAMFQQNSKKLVQIGTERTA